MDVYLQLFCIHCFVHKLIIMHSFIKLLGRKNKLHVNQNYGGTIKCVFIVFIIVYVKPTNIVNVTTIKNTKPYFEDRFELC